METQVSKNNLLLNSLINVCPFAEPSDNCILKPYRNGGYKNSKQFTKSEASQIMISHNNCVNKRNLKISFDFLPSVDEKLTEREKTVAEFILNYYDDKRIADELNISQHTANNHRKNIYRKLKVTNVLKLFKMFGKFKKN